MSPQELIQRAKLRATNKSCETFNWEEVEDLALYEWYFIGKVMGKIFPRTFPYFTFKGISSQIMKDPEYKKKEE